MIGDLRAAAFGADFAPLPFAPGLPFASGGFECRARRRPPARQLNSGASRRVRPSSFNPSRLRHAARCIDADRILFALALGLPQIHRVPRHRTLRARCEPDRAAADVGPRPRMTHEVAQRHRKTLVGMAVFVDSQQKRHQPAYREARADDHIRRRGPGWQRSPRVSSPDSIVLRTPGSASPPRCRHPRKKTPPRRKHPAESSCESSPAFAYCFVRAARRDRAAQPYYIRTGESLPREGSLHDCDDDQLPEDAVTFPARRPSLARGGEFRIVGLEYFVEFHESKISASL